MFRNKRHRAVLSGLLAWMLVPAAIADTPQVVIYRCTDASGALTVQNDEPCPAGSRQQRSVIEPAPAMPAYAPPVAPAPAAPDTGRHEAQPLPAPPARPQVPARPPVAEADRLPPPPIYRCHTPDNRGSYTSEDAEPGPRCVPLQTVGINGDPGLGAGAACEWKQDRCERIPDEEACDGWRRRGREIESAWRYARGNAKAPLQEEFARVARILEDTTCGVPGG